MEKDRFEAFYNLIASSTKSIHKLKSKGMLPFGLTSAHTICLRQLYERPEGVTRTQLSDLCIVDKAQITRIISELTEKGYAIEQRGAHANYRSKLFLTDEGKRVTEEINGIVLRINNFVSGDIPEDNIRIFYETFTKICENLKIAEDMI